MATIGKRTSVYTYSVRQSKSRYSFVDSVLRQKLSTLLRLARPCHITPVLTPPSLPFNFLYSYAPSNLDVSVASLSPYSPVVSAVTTKLDRTRFRSALACFHSR